MTAPSSHDTDLISRIAALKRAGQPFALATVVRTVAATAAKAGAKAVILPDGTLEAGWIGGGCARGAVLKAAREALEDGAPRLISVQPETALAEHGVAPGDTRDGIRFARNMCPSQGTMDIFIEAVMPAPDCVICGTSPVALALAELAPRFGFAVTACAPAEDQPAFAAPDRRVEGYAFEVAPTAERYVVVATQGKGDEAALRAALAAPAAYLGFVGSRAKVASLKHRLCATGVPEAAFEPLHAPAGLNLGAITPEEIALSILAEMVATRRAGQRGTQGD
ncbi:XdhC family protein [Rhodovulum iodosum]|nr:XdhC/CoxI family protein [Rhodovulum robiginosum]